MLKKTWTLTVVSPPPLRLPPNAITPEQVIRYHRSKRRGSKGRQALSPPSSCMWLIFHSLIKEFYRVPIIIFTVYDWKKMIEWFSPSWKQTCTLSSLWISSKRHCRGIITWNSGTFSFYSIFVSLSPRYPILHRHDNRNVEKDIAFCAIRPGKIPFTCTRWVLLP